MKKEIVLNGVVAECDGKFYGIQYEDGKCREDDFGNIENAKICDPQFCRRPKDMMTPGSGILEFNRAKLRKIKKTTIYEIDME